MDASVEVIFYKAVHTAGLEQHIDNVTRTRGHLGPVCSIGFGATRLQPVFGSASFPMRYHNIARAAANVSWGIGRARLPGAGVLVTQLPVRLRVRAVVRRNPPLCVGSEAEDPIRPSQPSLFVPQSRSAEDTQAPSPCTGLQQCCIQQRRLATSPGHGTRTHGTSTCRTRCVFSENL